MSRSARNLPKEIAAFGKKQFEDTGAECVEVLRVKASTIRKHFRQLQGVRFLVSVIEQNRVRVYLFSSNGVLLLGENIEVQRYGKVRKKSRLIMKYEKPVPLTEEELRIEATQEVKDRLSKSIRRVARFLNLKEPQFPDIYVSREKIDTSPQGFGLLQEDAHVLLFDEKTLKETYSDGVILRAALFTFLDTIPSYLTDLSSCLANAIAFYLLSADSRTRWLEVWQKASKGTELQPLVSHLVYNVETYQHQGFGLLLDLLKGGVTKTDLQTWLLAIDVIHDSIEVPIGTEDTQAFLAFLKDLQKPKRIKKRMNLPSIHLTPRPLCNPVPLGTVLKLSEGTGKTQTATPWLEVISALESKRSYLCIDDSTGVPLMKIEYRLNIDDIFPKPHGILSAGRDILNRAFRLLGIDQKDEMTFSAKLELRESTLTPAKLAILERLITGSSQVVLDTIIGSPKRLVSLIDGKHVLLLPDFNHLGLRPDFLISGPIEDIRDVVTRSCLESTLFLTEESAYGIVSSPGIWGQSLRSLIVENNLCLSPILKTHSTHGLLRGENDILASG